MGSVAARDLVERTELDVAIADVNEPALEALAGSFRRRVHTKVVDVEDDEALRSAFEDTDVVLNATFMRWIPRVTRAVIDAGVHLVDLGAYWPETAEQLALDDQAREAGCRIVPGCGVAPGLTNILARLGADRLDTVHEIRFASYITHPLTTSPGIVYTRFDASTGASLVLREGKLVEEPSFGEEETVSFPAPYGNQRVHLVPHPEPLTLPKYLRGTRDIDFKVGYPEDDTRRLRSLLELGFDGSEPFGYGGARIVPRDFAAAFIGRAGLAGIRTANVKHVTLEGLKDGRSVRIVYDFATEREDRSASSAVTGTMAAISAAIVADGGGKVGVHPPEGAFDPQQVLTALEGRGFVVVES